MGCFLVAVLQDLDCDYDGVSGASGENGEVPADVTGGTFRSALGELRQSGRRNVEPYEIQPSRHEGKVVPPVSTSDIQTDR